MYGCLIFYLKVHPETTSVPNSMGERWVGPSKQSCSAVLFKTVRDPSGSELRIIPLRKGVKEPTPDSYINKGVYYLSEIVTALNSMSYQYNLSHY